MVNDGEDIRVSSGKVAVVFISIVAFLRRVLGNGGALELINADRLGKLDIPVPYEFLHHGKDNIAGGEGTHSRIMDGSDSPIEPRADGEAEAGWIK